jgi:hypothetical protein
MVKFTKVALLRLEEDLEHLNLTFLRATLLSMKTRKWWKKLQNQNGMI